MLLIDEPIVYRLNIKTRTGILDLHDQPLLSKYDANNDGPVRILIVAVAKRIGECFAQDTVFTDQFVAVGLEPLFEKSGKAALIAEKPIIPGFVR